MFLSWSEDDQDKAVAFVVESQKVCSGCGTRQEEWDRDREAYLSDMRRCPGCELLEMEKDNIPGNDNKGVKVFLVKNSPGVETSDGLW